ncbi:MAG: site-specific integrase [Candidatus Sulfopaludibacter sp.]|nr:site-specific integrase [Candidatus Sulfopaludibacter sp.]
MGKRGNSEGSIYHMKDGRWRAAVVVGWKTNAAGDKKPDRKVFTAATRHEVAQQLNDALKDQSRGINIKPEKTTLGAFLKSWLETVAKPSVRPKTLRTYSDLVRLHIAPALGSIQLAKLMPQHVREFQNEALTKLQPSRKKVKKGETAAPGKPLSPRTVKHLLVTLRTALESAVKDGLVPRNVATIVDAPSVAKPQMKTLSQDQARAFLKAIQGDRLETLFSTAIALAYRQGEALALQWPDVDFEKDSLTVRQSIQRIAGKLTITPTKKDKIHSVPLPAVTKSALLAHKTRQDEERRLAGARWQETGFVFTTLIGTPIDARSVIRRFHQILETSSLPRIRFHDLRHSAATLLLAQGVSPRYISELLGHAQVSFTMQTYAHVLPHVQREAAAKMNEILSLEPVATSVATKPPAPGPN